ncbi:MAG: aminotransferase class V-fold PLP-dependent enzyme, partial [Fimbriimonadaceae bacterium]|nr:aminotransferase class V-fold PLP-dependent enzyme [Fimbriimonadaceae bacterium]
MISLTIPSIEAIRNRFPSLEKGEVYMDNAGGSQVPETVADSIRDYMLTSYVQVGADYPASQRATDTVDQAHDVVHTIMGGEDVGRTFFGSSSSTLCRMLADCYAEALRPGDEIIVGESGHEANVGPWMNLLNRGVSVKLWPANPVTGVCDLETLREMLGERTKVVVFVQVSNILGHVEEFQACIDAAHSVGARVVMDGVAYAPHLPVDVAAWGVDWYVFSCYKVFGPHMGALYGKNDAIAELTGPNHYFLAKDYLPGKFELGNANHESCAGVLGLVPYLNWLAGSEAFDRETVLKAWGAMEYLERPLTEQLLYYLRTKSSVRVIGRASLGPGRVPTVSFLHDRRSPREMADAAIPHGIGIRWGNFYSVRLLERMGIDPASGVARVSLAH